MSPDNILNYPARAKMHLLIANANKAIFVDEDHSTEHVNVDTCTNIYWPAPRNLVTTTVKFLFAHKYRDYQKVEISVARIGVQDFTYVKVRMYHMRDTQAHQDMVEETPTGYHIGKGPHKRFVSKVNDGRNLENPDDAIDTGLLMKWGHFLCVKTPWIANLGALAALYFSGTYTSISEVYIADHNCLGNCMFCIESPVMHVWHADVDMKVAQGKGQTNHQIYISENVGRPGDHGKCWGTLSYPITDIDFRPVMTGDLVDMKGFQATLSIPIPSPLADANTSTEH